jgi:hypothetical protein
MAEEKLHELVVAYKASGKGRDAIIEQVAAMLYTSHETYGFDDEDDAADAFLKYRERIARLVDRFEDRGLPFDAYLATSLRFLARTVRRERRRCMERTILCERSASDDSSDAWRRAEADPTEAGDGEGGAPIAPGICLPFRADPGASGPMESRAPSGRPRRRPRARGGLVRSSPSEAARSSRLVFLAVKCAWELDDESVDRVADSAGVPRDWLASAVGQARRSLEPELSRRDRLVERRNSSWCRRRLLESKLEGETDPMRRERMEASLDRERRRFGKALEELGAFRPVVPNSVVARILGVPKGTVDSGLYYLRRQHLGARAEAPLPDRAARG